MGQRDLAEIGRDVYLRSSSYVSWCPSMDWALVDGRFTPDDLEALAAFMRQEQKRALAEFA